MKLICIKETQYIWSQDIYQFEVGDIVDGDMKLCFQTSILSLCNWRENFMTLAEHRDKKIDDILNEE